MRMSRGWLVWLVVCALGLSVAEGAGKPAPGPSNLLHNPSFADGLDPQGTPKGWQRYGGGGQEQRLSLVEHDAGKAMLIEDDDSRKPFGVSQTVPIEPGQVYTAIARVKAVAGGLPNAGTLLLRFGSSNFGMKQFGPAKLDRFTEFSLVGTAAANAKSATVYVYSRKQRNCKFMVAEVKLLQGAHAPADEPKATGPMARRGPGLGAQPAPVYKKLKDLHMTTWLVRGGKPTAVIVAPESGTYDEQARLISQTIRDLTGVPMPIVTDTAPDAAVPIEGNLIALGNRSTNKTIEKLYNRHFTLLDLRYPGQDGHVVRTLHNPFGAGRNVVFVGGSDSAGVDAATAQFVKRIREAEAGRDSLGIGRIADIKLPPGVDIPKDMSQFPLWSQSVGYRHSGVFGWSILSKRAALYYMTGDPFHAREFLRLAFPDRKAVKEIRAVDKGKVDVSDPLTGLDHYRAHRAILYWDLIEESPVFTDAERLKVTNAFARGLKHRRQERCCRLSGPASSVSSRHGQWGAVCVYTLCRYFARDYPEKVWKEGLQLVEWEFDSLHNYDWVHGENDNLFWYTTSMEPLTHYLLLSGDRVPMDKGVFHKIMAAQEALIPGTPQHRHLRYGALSWFHKVAYLTQDGRWIYYRDMTGMLKDDTPFRLGQSFWPEDHLKATPPRDRCGKWTIDFMPKARWAALGNDLPLEETFTFGSFRSAPDGSGDYILIDGYNGQGRNPYHCFAILELRIDGHTLLDRHENQLIVKVDGMVEPAVAKHAALKRCGVVGQTAFVTAEVPNHAYCQWRRTIAQRIGRYALVADELTFRTDSDNVEVQTKWWNPPHSWDAKTNRVLIPIKQDGRTVETFALCPSDVVEAQMWKFFGILSRFIAVEQGQRVVQFSLLAATGEEPAADGAACLRVADNAAALRVAAPRAAPGFIDGLAVAGQYDETHAALAILTEADLHGEQLTQAGLGSTLMRCDKPLDVEWHFARGELWVHAAEPTRLSLALSDRAGVRLDGKPVSGQEAGGMAAVDLAPGKHALSGAKPSAMALSKLARSLSSLRKKAQIARAKEASGAAAEDAPAGLPAFEPLATAQIGGRTVDLEVIPHEGDPLIAAAVGKTIHVLDFDGRVVQKLETDGDVRVIHWWPEAQLLLAGCKDEKVIAFGLDPSQPAEPAARRWEFTSQMAPWVYTNKASHWWKEASPRHAGVHGLTSGRFLDKPQSQAIVGSACTVEVLDPRGKLLLRKEQIWGDIVHMLIIPRPDGTRNLLSVRRPSLTSRVNILNSASLSVQAAGFHDVPEGHTDIKSWGRARYHLFHADLDADGEGEVIGEISGPWDRVTVWDETGKAKASAPFGPGMRSSHSLRDLDVADLDGDGTREILVGTDRGLLVALDARCEKVWSRRLKSPPRVFAAVSALGGNGSRLVVGCDDGSVLLLDPAGQPLRVGRVPGRPQHIAVATRAGVPHVVLTTGEGEVCVLPVKD